MDIKKILDKLLEKFQKKILKAINLDYNIGSAITLDFAKSNGVKTNRSVLNLTKEQQERNIEMINSLIEDVNMEVAKKINYLTNKATSEKWDNKMLVDEISKLNIEETYKNRFENIATTESFRIMNNSADNTARRLGAKKKYLYNLVDDRTAEDSLIAKEKYDGEDKAIPIDEPFRYEYKGKERVYMYSPDRPRDRSFTLYLYKE